MVYGRTFAQFVIIRSRHHRFSLRKGDLRNFSKFTRKHLCQTLFLNKVAGLKPTSIKKRLWHRCFPVSFEKFLGIPFLQSTSGRLLLDSLNCFWFQIFLLNTIALDTLFLRLLLKLFLLLQKRQLYLANISKCILTKIFIIRYYLSKVQLLLYLSHE